MIKWRHITIMSLFVILLLALNKRPDVVVQAKKTSPSFSLIQGVSAATEKVVAPAQALFKAATTAFAEQIKPAASSSTPTVGASPTSTDAATSSPNPSPTTSAPASPQPSPIPSATPIIVTVTPSPSPSASPTVEPSPSFQSVTAAADIFPQGNFNPDGRGNIIVSVTNRYASGFIDVSVSGTLTGLASERIFKVWLCDDFASCGTNVNPEIKTDSGGNANFSGVNFSNNQNRYPISKIKVFAELPNGSTIPTDGSYCGMTTANDTPCLAGSIHLDL